MAILWTLAIIFSYAWNTHQENKGVIEVARTQARTAYQKDIIYRRWNSFHGGVYVPKTEKTPSNEFLDVPERDITTPSGRELTLVNPAFMTRQVQEIAAKIYGVQGHITSLKPIRPANAAADWEASALKKFEGGLKEFSAIELIDGEPYMHLIRPLLTETGCLACHSKQGYIVGDVRGGLSVSVPMAPIYAVANTKKKSLMAAHSLLWILGMLGIVVSGRIIHQRVMERDIAEVELQRSQKLESIGHLAGGLAHEINSPIQFIQDNAQFFSESLDDIFESLDKAQGIEKDSDLEYLRGELPKAIESFSGGVDQIATIVRAMIDISRPGCSEIQPTNINELISSAIILSRNRWIEVAELNIDLDPDVPLIDCIPGEFSQIILNIIINSVDSIKEMRKPNPERQGKILVTTRDQGDWVEIRVENDGQDQVVAQQLIPEIHAGQVILETEEESGCAYVIRLPVLVGV